MPKRLPIRLPTPRNVAAATRVFGSELRLHLVRYYAAQPGSRQIDAVRALDIERAVVSANTRVLLETGVLVAGPDRTLTVDRTRLDELTRAVEEFGHPPEPG